MPFRPFAWSDDHVLFDCQLRLCVRLNLVLSWCSVMAAILVSACSGGFAMVAPPSSPPPTKQLNKAFYLSNF
jgi:hypothetical protein